MNIKEITITPEDAETLLQLNTGNRPVNKSHVSALAREMKLGRWKLNGDTICVNKERLIDGQHRLLAIVQSGVSIRALVVNGLSSDVFDTKDVGKRRSPGDTLAVRGETNTKLLAGALAVVDQYLTGRMDQCVRYTNMEIEEILEKHPGVRDSIKKTLVTKRLLSGSVLTACHYLFSRLDEFAADRFVSDLISGSLLEEDDPVYLLRERLMTNLHSKSKLNRRYVMALVVKAWNHRRAGRRIKVLKFSEGPTNAEQFPIIR